VAFEGNARLISDEKIDSGFKKLSQKERTLLFILAVVAIAVLGVWFLLLPAYNSISTVYEELETLKSQEFEYRNEIMLAEMYEKMLDDAQAEYEKYSSYFYDLMEPESIDERITGMLTDNGMTPATLSMTLLEVKGVLPYTVSELRVNPVPKPVDSEADNEGGESDSGEPAGDGAETDKDDAEAKDSKSFVYTVNITAHGERDNLYDFLTQAAGMTAFEVTSYSFGTKIATTEAAAASDAAANADSQELIKIEIKLYVFVEGVAVEDLEKK